VAAGVQPRTLSNKAWSSRRDEERDECQTATQSENVHTDTNI
jgi:hypothetical protein